MKFTIQQAAAILIDRGMTFECLGTILVDGKFITRYRVNGEVLNAGQVKNLIESN